MRVCLLLCLPAILLCGCAAVKSIPTAAVKSDGAGLVYRLPLKKIQLIVTVSETGKKLTPSVAVSPAYPDPTKSYYLTMPRSQFGSTDLDIGVGENGLLKTAKSTSTSAVKDVLDNVAATVGTVQHAFSVSPRTPNAPPDENYPQCTTDGTYSIYVDIPGKPVDAPVLCRVKFEISPVSGWKAPASSAPAEGKSLPGFFYRQLKPFQIVASPKGRSQEQLAFLAFVPDPEQVSFLPVPRTFFASNTTSMAFTDGMPTEYKPQVNSEVVGLLKIPADVLGAYFGAVGNVFTAFGGSKEKELNAAKNDALLQAQQYQIRLCLNAIAAKADAETITSLCPAR